MAVVAPNWTCKRSVSASISISSSNASLVYHYILQMCIRIHVDIVVGGMVGREQDDDQN